MMSVFWERGERTVAEVQGPRKHEGADEIEVVRSGEGTTPRMFCC